MSRPRQDWPTLSPLVVLAGVVLVLYFAREILIPLALALTLNFLLTPLVLFFQRRSLRRVPAVALAVVISAMLLGGIGWIVAKQLLQVANDLPKYGSRIHTKIDSFHYQPGSALGRATHSVEELAEEFSTADTNQDTNLPKSEAESRKANSFGTQMKTVGPLPVQVVTVPVHGVTYMREVLGPAIVPLATTGMVLIFTVFILIEQEDLRDRLLRLAGVGQLHTMTLALDDASHRISRYLVMQFLVNACYGICFGAGLFFIGIPNAFLWGVIAGLLRIVPYVGALTATVFPLALALAIFDGWAPPVLVVVLFVTLESLASNVVEPWLYGVHTGISSLALLVTTAFWTALWGWAGLVLAIPLTVCVIVLGRYVPRMSFLHILLGDERALSVEAQFYQRLLALDQEDARLIANNFLKTHTLVGLYDNVLVPALTLAEHDRHKGALDERRESFLYLSVSEIISELSVYGIEDAAGESRKLKMRKPGNAREAAFEYKKNASSTRIFCFPANDQADEITSSMLAQLLERNGYGVLFLPAGSAFEEILTHIPPEPGDVVCISALPPFAFAQSCALCQRIRILLPNIRILAGVWGFSGNLDKARERFGSTHPDRVVASLAEAVEQINDWQKTLSPQ